MSEEETLPPEAASSPAARIITAELHAALRRYQAAHGGPAPRQRTVPHWADHIREWPGKVIPANQPQVQAAVLTLLSRTLWSHHETSGLVAAFSPLYAHGWCNDAIIVAMDYDPDNTRRPPWHIGDGKTYPRIPLKRYIANRLNRWGVSEPWQPADTPKIPEPPLAGTTFDAWAERMITFYGNGERRPRRSRATHPRDADDGIATAMTRIQRARQPRTSFEALLGSEPTAPAVDTATQTGYPADPDAALLADIDVRDTLTRLLRSRQPAPQHLRELRRAVRFARATSSGPIPWSAINPLLADLTGPDGEPLPIDLALKLIRRM